MWMQIVLFLYLNLKTTRVQAITAKKVKKVRLTLERNILKTEKIAFSMRSLYSAPHA